jgi:hypothetical protein
MSALDSMVGNLTLPYLRGAYVQEIALGDDLEPGLTAVPAYSFDDFAVRTGTSPWDIAPLYLIAPRGDLGDEPVCLYFGVRGAPPGEPWPSLHVPAGTAGGVPFVVPLGDQVTGTTVLTHLREWPAPPPGPGGGPPPPGGRGRWRLLAVVGNLGRLLWVLGGERATLAAVVGDVGTQRKLAAAHGRSLDLLGQELLVPRLPPSAYPPDPATIALYHLDDLPTDADPLAAVQMRVHDAADDHDGLNEGAVPGAPGRFLRAFRFRSGELPAARCAAERTFQQRLRNGDWDATAGVREVRAGPYLRYGYREGAISVPGPDDAEHPVWVNDEARDPTARGLVTTACSGFVPEDLERTIERLGRYGGSPQQAIDFFGEWWGLPEAWFAAAYERHGIATPHERCPLPEVPVGYVRIPNDRAFAIPADQSFTVEAFVLPTPTGDERLRVVAIKSREIFYGGPLQVHCLEGWALSMGRFNCIPNNVAWSLSDVRDSPPEEHGNRVLTVTADLDLGDGAWHHLAGVIDRRHASMRLYVDGVERGCRHLGPVGAIDNQEDVLLGNADYRFDAPYDGLIDEVRLSNVARRSFHPVLGESDGRYRTRLSIYRRWLVPTFDELAPELRRLAATSPYGPEVPAPALPEVELSERQRTHLCAERRLTIRPLALPPGGHIDLQGSRELGEQEACGAGDQRFYEWQLVEHDRQGIEYAQPASRRMQLAAARSLDELARRLGPLLGTTGRLRVLAAFQPGLDPRAAVGRSLLLEPPAGLPNGVLAAFAHAACFDWVLHGPGGTVRAVVREEADKLDVTTAEEAAAQAWPQRGSVVDLELGSTVRLLVPRPVLPDARLLDWSLVQCGPARARLEEMAGQDAARLLVPGAPGRLTVQAEITWRGTVVAGRRDVRVLPGTVPPCQSIAADGTLDATEEAAAGTPAGFFHEALLLEHDDDRVDHPGGPAARRMQLGLARTLDALLALLDAEPGITGRLQVLRGYDPDADDLASVGRKLLLAHTGQAAMPLGRLAALAHRAGFAWVEHPAYADGIWVAAGPEPPLEVVPGPIERLAPNAEVNWLGIMRAGVPEAPVPTGASFDATDPANTHSDPSGRVVYDTLAANLMTPATQAVLDALLDRLDAEGAAGQLHLLGAFSEDAPNRRRIGAALQFRHDTVPLDRLGALAYLAGFDYVKHVTVPDDQARWHVYGSVWRGEDVSGASPEELPELVDFGLLDLADRSELAEGAVAELRTCPDALAGLPSGTQDAWCLTRYGPAQGRLDTPPAAGHKLLTAERAGVAGARVDLLIGDGAEPYRFELLVAPDAEGAAVVPSVPKAVYDDLMNFLDAHLPIGVEGRTLALRRHVPELLADPRLRDAGTELTYPHYRQRQREGELPRPAGDPTEITCPCPPWPAGEAEGADHD